MDKDLFFQLLYYQFFNGCEKVICNNPLCMRNPKSVLHSKSREEKIKLIEEFSQKVDKTKLCDGIPLRFSAKKCFHSVVFFDNWARGLKKVINVRQASAFFQSIFCNTEYAGYILMQDNIIITESNPSIDEVYLLEFITKISDVADLKDEINHNLKLSLEFISANQIRMKFSYFRLLLLTLYFPALQKSTGQDPMILQAFAIMLKFKAKCRSILISYLSRLTELRRMMINYCHSEIEHLIKVKTQYRPHCKEIENIVKIMEIMYEANKIAINPLPPSFFVDEKLNEAIDPNVELVFTKHSQTFRYIQYPFILPLNAKVHAAKNEMRTLLRKYTINGESKHMKLNIRRSEIVADAVDKILAQSKHAFVRKLKVCFVGEKAIDAGGPSREFLYLLSEKLLSPEYGMFVYVSGVRWFSQSTLESERSFFLVGTVLGLAIRNNVILPIRFPRVLYKKLLEDKPLLNLGDLAEVLPEVAKSLNSILEMRSVGEDVSSLCLTFETSIECFGQVVSVPLIEGMGDVPVTNENVEQYVDAYVNFELDGRIKTSFEAFKKGFNLAYPGKIIRLLEPAELDIVVSGNEVYDWGSLKEKTKYLNTTERSKPIQYFWDIFNGFQQKEKLNLLKFITGSDRSPLGGLKNVKMTINLIKDENRLPTSHTCFSTFDLPAYSTKEKMFERLMYAINETEGFGLI